MKPTLLTLVLIFIISFAFAQGEKESYKPIAVQFEKKYNTEERFLNEVLWQYYTDNEIRDIERQILASIPPDILAVESRWMMKGMSNPEIIAWLRVVKQTAPEAVFFSLLALAEEVLAKTRWKIVNVALVDGMMVA